VLISQAGSSERYAKD